MEFPTAPTPTTSATPPPTTPAPGDVCALLSSARRGDSQKLNWRPVDLLKLLDIDGSLSARRELATELDCPAELMGD